MTIFLTSLAARGFVVIANDAVDAVPDSDTKFPAL